MITVTDEMVENIKAAIREHIKIDASGIAPAVAGYYLTGFDEAARAVAAALRAAPAAEPASHNWVRSTLGHGDAMCSRCKITNREAAVLGCLDRCDVPEAAPPAPMTDSDIREEAAELVKELRYWADNAAYEPAARAFRLAARFIEGVTLAPAAEPVAVKPLEWVEDHGVSGMGPYRLFYAVTPSGRFVYGTDALGDTYWHPPSSGVYTVDSEEAAKRAAERSWEKYALAEAGKFLRLAAPAGMTSPLGDAWTREDLATGLAMLDGVTLKDVRSTVGPAEDASNWREYLGRADDLLVHLSVAAAYRETEAEQ